MGLPSGFPFAPNCPPRSPASRLAQWHMGSATPRTPPPDRRVSGPKAEVAKVCYGGVAELAASNPRQLRGRHYGPIRCAPDRSGRCYRYCSWRRRMGCGPARPRPSPQPGLDIRRQTALRVVAPSRHVDPGPFLPTRSELRAKPVALRHLSSSDTPPWTLPPSPHFAGSPDPSG